MCIKKLKRGVLCDPANPPCLRACRGRQLESNLFKAFTQLLGTLRPHMCSSSITQFKSPYDGPYRGRPSSIQLTSLVVRTLCQLTTLSLLALIRTCSRPQHWLRPPPPFLHLSPQFPRQPLALYDVYQTQRFRVGSLLLAPPRTLWHCATRKD
jgi:hypothetical protein